MESEHRALLARGWAITAALFALAAPAASADPGQANCQGALAERGNSYIGDCVLPFQGFPVGVAGTYDSAPGNPADPGLKPADAHVELLAKMSFGPPRAIGVECVIYGKGVVRCQGEYNPFDRPVSAVEPVPAEIVGIVCKAGSHSPFSKLAPPAGTFACWSGAAARADLEKDGYFRDNGFGEPEPEPEPDGPGALDPLTGAGVSTAVTTVPFNTYAPDRLVVSRSLGLRYVNADAASHDIVAIDARRPDGSAPWCGGFKNLENPASQDCPLFWTPVIAGGGTQTPVLGLEDAKVGETYRFMCSIHPYMVGTIEVVE